MTASEKYPASTSISIQNNDESDAASSFAHLTIQSSEIVQHIEGHKMKFFSICPKIEKILRKLPNSLATRDGLKVLQEIQEQIKEIIHRLVRNDYVIPVSERHFPDGSKKLYDLAKCIGSMLEIVVVIKCEIITQVKQNTIKTAVNQIQKAECDERISNLTQHCSDLNELLKDTAECVNKAKKSLPSRTGMTVHKTAEFLTKPLIFLALGLICDTYCYMKGDDKKNKEKAIEIYPEIEKYFYKVENTRGYISKIAELIRSKKVDATTVSGIETGKMLLISKCNEISSKSPSDTGALQYLVLCQQTIQVCNRWLENKEHLCNNAIRLDELVKDINELDDLSKHLASEADSCLKLYEEWSDGLLKENQNAQKENPRRYKWFCSVFGLSNAIQKCKEDQLKMAENVQETFRKEMKEKREELIEMVIKEDAVEAIISDTEADTKSVRNDLETLNAAIDCLSGLRIDVGKLQRQCSVR